MCLVLAPHNGNGWKGKHWGLLPSLSFNLWQRENRWNGCKLWKVFLFSWLLTLWFMLNCVYVEDWICWNRLVAEVNSERKQKSQKAKPKVSEGRMHLSNVRVIKRNLVYIIGLPLDLADEDVRSFQIIVHPIFYLCLGLMCFRYFFKPFLWQEIIKGS